MRNSSEIDAKAVRPRVPFREASPRPWPKPAAGPARGEGRGPTPGAARSGARTGRGRFASFRRRSAPEPSGDFSPSVGPQPRSDEPRALRTVPAPKAFPHVRVSLFGVTSIYPGAYVPRVFVVEYLVRFISRFCWLFQVPSSEASWIYLLAIVDNRRIFIFIVPSSVS